MSDDEHNFVTCPTCAYRFPLGTLVGAVYCSKCGRRFNPTKNLDETVIYAPGAATSDTARGRHDSPFDESADLEQEDSGVLPIPRASAMNPSREAREDGVPLTVDGSPVRTNPLSSPDTTAESDPLPPAGKKHPLPKNGKTPRPPTSTHKPKRKSTPTSRRMPIDARALAASEADHQADGTPFGEYDLIEEIARGGMGVVYRARQRSLKRIVALKLLRAGDDASDEERERLLREAKASASLSHPNIVPIHEFSSWQGRPYYTMDFIDGEALDQVLDRGPMQPNEACALIEVVARAIHYAHSRGIVHRDLKPANIILDRAGRPMVTDFGLAVDLGPSAERDRITRRGAVMGTIPYIPPEQAQGHIDRIDARSDVYSLGAVLYEMVTGRPPIQGGTQFELLRRVIHMEPVRPRQLNPRLHRDVETICLRCLEKNPDRRYPTADALADDCRAFLSGEIIQARPVGPLYRAWKWAVRRWPVTALAALTPLLVFAFSLVASMEKANRAATLQYTRTLNEREKEINIVRATTQSLITREWRTEYATEFGSDFESHADRADAVAANAVWMDPERVLRRPVDGHGLVFVGVERPVPAWFAALTGTPTPVGIVSEGTGTSGAAAARPRPANGAVDPAVRAASSTEPTLEGAEALRRWLPSALFGLPSPFPLDFRLKLSLRFPAHPPGELFVYIDTDRDFNPATAQTVLRVGAGRHPGAEFRRGVVDLAVDRAFAWASDREAVLTVQRLNGRLSVTVERPDKEPWTLSPERGGFPGESLSGFLALGVADGQLEIAALSVEVMGLSRTMVDSAIELAQRFAAQGEFALAAQLYERVSLENTDSSARRLMAVRECVRALVRSLPEKQRTPQGVRETVEALVTRWRNAGRYWAGEMEYLVGLGCNTLATPEGYAAALDAYDHALQAARATPRYLTYSGWQVVGPFFDPGAPHILSRPLPPEGQPDSPSYVVAGHGLSWRAAGNAHRPNETLAFAAPDDHTPGNTPDTSEGGFFFAKRQFIAEHPLQARLRLHVNGGVAVWLGDRRVAYREYAPVPDAPLEIDVNLPVGPTLLLVKVQQQQAPLTATIVLEAVDDQRAGRYGQLARLAIAANLLRNGQDREAIDVLTRLRDDGVLNEFRRERLGDILHGVVQRIADAIDAHIEKGNGSLAMAEELVRIMADMAPDRQQVAERFRAIGRAWYRRDAPERGAVLFADSRKLAPDRPEPWIEESALRIGLAGKENIQQAEALLEQGLLALPGSVELWIASALFHVAENPAQPGKARDPVRARAEAMKAVELTERRNPAALVLAGRAYMALGEPEYAYAFATEALLLEENTEAARLRGDAQQAIARAAQKRTVVSPPLGGGERWGATGFGEGDASDLMDPVE